MANDEKKIPLMLMVKHLHKEWGAYMKKVSAEAGVPDSYRLIVMYLSRNPGATQKEIAVHSKVTHVAVSNTIKDMENDGYIRKEIDEKDRRVTRLYLTEKGKMQDDMMKERIHGADRKITETLTPEKEAEFYETIEKIIETIRKELM